MSGSHGSVRVKICGLTHPDDVRAAVEAGADAVGIVCDVPIETPRAVTMENAASLVQAVPPFVTTVLVTMPKGPGRAIELAQSIDPDVLQLHGGMRPGDLAYLRAQIAADVFLAVDADELEGATRYDDLADALVVDSTDDQGAGGTGETHDWSRTSSLASSLESPIVLAGGLTPENVCSAIDTVSPYAVDVASGVEREPGRKDHRRVREFVAAASSTDHPTPNTLEP